MQFDAEEDGSPFLGGIPAGVSAKPAPESLPAAAQDDSTASPIAPATAASEEAGVGGDGTEERPEGRETDEDTLAATETGTGDDEQQTGAHAAAAAGTTAEQEA